MRRIQQKLRPIGYIETALGLVCVCAMYAYAVRLFAVTFFSISLAKGGAAGILPHSMETYVEGGVDIVAAFKFSVCRTL